MTPRPEYARHRADGNQAEIITALEKAGASVERIGRPLDLLVGFRSKTFLLEIKQPGGKLNPEQSDFLKLWPGQAAVVHSPTEALEAIGIIRDPWKGSKRKDP